jgi:chromosome segregation ATPase
MRDSKIYDLENEEETMQVLRVQNKKIQDLYSEIERRDDMIEKLRQDKISVQIDEYELQLANHKKQIETLEEKNKLIQNNFNDRNETFQNQMKKTVEYESKMKIQLSHKEKLLHEYQSSITLIEGQNSKLKEDISQLNESLCKYKAENEELKKQVKCNHLKNTLMEDEIKLISNEKESILRSEKETKTELDEKIEDLIELLKQQNFELNNQNQKLVRMEKENQNLKFINTSYKKEIDNLLINVKELKTDLDKLKLIENKCIQSENLISDLQNFLNSERSKNTELVNNLNTLNEKFQHFKQKHSGENSPEYLNQIIISNNEEISDLNRKLNTYKELLNNKENFLKDLQSDIQSYTAFVNNNLSTILKWTDTYLGIYVNKNNISVPNININCFTSASKALLGENIKFEEFVIILTRIRQKLNSDLELYEENLIENQKSYSELENKYNLIFKENSELKAENFKINEDVLGLTNLSEKLKLELKFCKEGYSNQLAILNERENQRNRFVNQINEEFSKIYADIRENQRMSSYSDFIAPKFSKVPQSNLEGIFLQMKDFSTNFIELFKVIWREFIIAQNKLDELNILKTECETIKFDFTSLKKTQKEEVLKQNREKSEYEKSLEKIKFDQLRRIEEEYKTKVERLQKQVNEKEEIINGLIQNDTLLKSQLLQYENDFQGEKSQKELNE